MARKMRRNETSGGGIARRLWGMEDSLTGSWKGFTRGGRTAGRDAEVIRQMQEGSSTDSRKATKWFQEKGSEGEREREGGKKEEVVRGINCRRESLEWTQKGGGVLGEMEVSEKRMDGSLRESAGGVTH